MKQQIVSFWTCEFCLDIIECLCSKQLCWEQQSNKGSGRSFKGWDQETCITYVAVLLYIFLSSTNPQSLKRVRWLNIRVWSNSNKHIQQMFKNYLFCLIISFRKALRMVKIPHHSKFIEKMLCWKCKKNTLRALWWQIAFLIVSANKNNVLVQSGPQLREELG